jgi:hypothetical protein
MWLMPSKIVSIVRYKVIKELLDSEERGKNIGMTAMRRCSTNSP